MSDKSRDDEIVRLVVGNGCCSLTTMRHVLQREPDSLLSRSVKQNGRFQFDPQLLPFADNTLIVNRNVQLVCILLDALRHPQMHCTLPDNFDRWDALLTEAQYFGLVTVTNWIQQNVPRPCTVTLAYHGTLAHGKQGFASDVNFRRISRILVSGKASVCRQIFGETLNEGRDCAQGDDETRYTSRLYLKHMNLEKALDMLARNNFHLLTVNAHAPAAPPEYRVTDAERYLHYTQFVFQRRQCC